MIDTISVGLRLDKHDVIDQFTTIHNYIDTDAMILRKGSVSARKGENFWFQSIWEMEVSPVLENGMKTGTIRYLMELVV